MPIPFTCPYCGASWEVDDRHAGQSSTCSTCAQPVTFPQGVAPESEARSPRSTSPGVMAALIVVMAVLGVAVLGVIGWLLMPVIAKTQAVGQRNACANNMKQIALALNSYQQAYGTFPPAYLTDDKGKPMHSWRVLILPYMNASDVYKQYNFDEPWDSPHNSLLTTAMPAAYGCPANPDPKARRAGETNYMVITGKQTLFPAGGSVKASDVTDGLANTIMLVESTEAGVNWMSPHDLSLNTASLQINAGTDEPSSFHAEGGINVAMGDGTTHFLPQTTRSKALYYSLTIAGGEAAHLNAVP